jgi:hypothetical protein
MITYIKVETNNTIVKIDFFENKINKIYKSLKIKLENIFIKVV